MRTYRKGTFNLKKIAFLWFLASQAVVLSAIEAWFPFSLEVPGVKPGLANIIIVSILMFFNMSDALAIVLISCVISSFISGGPVIFLFSICGEILSVFVMWSMLKTMNKLFSLVGISIIGAITHNITQTLVACFIMTDLTVAAYLPELILSGIFIGSFVGICSTFLVKAMKRLNLISNF